MTEPLASPAEPSPADEVPASAPPERRFRLPRFGLRTAFVLAIVSCLFFAWVRWNYVQRQVEQAAVDALLAANAEIAFAGDEHAFMGTADQRAAEGLEPPVPTFGSRVSRSLGWTRVPPVERVRLKGDDPADPKLAPALAALRVFPKLWDVRLSGKAFDDRAMPELAKVPSLSFLVLEGTSVSGDGLATLASKESLRSVAITHDPTGDLVGGAVRLKRLDGMILSDAAIEREDVAALASFPHLQQLILSQIPFSDRSDLLLPLEGSKSLTQLTIQAEGVDEGAVVALPPLPRLERLEVHGLTLANLPPYPNLHSLNAEGITDEMLAKWPVPRRIRSATFYPPVTTPGLRPFAAVAAEWQCNVTLRPEGKP